MDENNPESGYTFASLTIGSITRKRKNKEEAMLKKLEKIDKKRWVRLIPMLFVATLWPIMLHYHETKTMLSDFAWFSDEQSISDIHFYWRVVLFLITAAFMAVVFFCDQCSAAAKAEKHQTLKERTKPFLPLILYLIMAGLSSICSDQTQYCFSMFYQMFEPVWVLFGYGMCAYYVAFFLREERDLRLLVRGFAICATIISSFGIMQMKGISVFSTGLMRWLVYPWDAELVENTTATDRLQNSAEMAFGNATFAGGYISFILPLVFILLLDSFYRKKKWIERIWYTALLVLLGINLYGTRTSTVVIGLAACVVIFVIFFRKRLHLKGWMLGGLGGLLVIGAIAGNAAMDGALMNKLTGAFNTETFAPALQAIETNKDNLTIRYQGETMILRVDASADFSWYEFHVTDDTGAELAYHPDEENPLIYRVDDPRFAGFSYGAFQAQLDRGVIQGVSLNIQGFDWYFTLDEDGYKYINQFTKLDKIQNPEVSPLFAGKEYLMSHRGYIWGRTLPMLKNYIFLGAGANSFFRIFPNNDYVTVYNLGDSYKFIDKPHNMYLQQFVQIGGVGCIAFIIFMIWYLIRCCRLYFHCEYKSSVERIGLGIMLGVIGYLIFGMANDSMPVLAPLFWCFIGMGIAVNYMVDKVRAEERIQTRKKE